MTTLVTITFGSHLYGTATPQSDFDVKTVFVPPARDILLQNVKDTYFIKRDKVIGERNVAGDIDIEGFSLKKYLKLVSEGQTVTLDMLFAPEWALKTTSPEWRELVNNRKRLITRKSLAFVGYCRSQANKYGIKGSRVAARRAALELVTRGLESLGASAKLHQMYSQTQYLIGIHPEHMSLTYTEDTNGRTYHWQVCGKKLPYTVKLSEIHKILEKMFNNYGHRSLLAEKQEGVDWKALLHAVRIAQQAIELLQTGNITFPRPNASALLDIKQGRVRYQEVAEMIEILLEEVEVEANKSSLPQEPDIDWIENFLVNTNYRQILYGYSLG